MRPSDIPRTYCNHARLHAATGWQPEIPLEKSLLDMLEVWRRYARDVSGRALDCGHFLPEERPQDVADDLERFFKITA